MGEGRQTGRSGAVPSGGVYQARNPRASALYQCAARHARELREAGRFRRAVEEQVIGRFLECGDPHYGFARIYCDGCGHEHLLAFSCKTRDFCPSCHQKRVLAYGKWVEDNALAPVAHRQYVFTLPRLLRPIFARRRAWLGELCRIAARLLAEAYAEALPGRRPGLVLFVQTFVDLVNFHPHVHVLAADGAFRSDGTFVPLPPVPEALLGEGFRHEVLNFLAAERAISDELARRMLTWGHSGFSVHNRVCVAAEDAEGRKQLARYLLRAPMSLEKMSYDAATATVIYRSKMHLRLKRNFPVMPGARWLELLAHSRPLRAPGALLRLVLQPQPRGEGGEDCVPGHRPWRRGRSAERVRASRAKAASARLIHKVYEADRFQCPLLAGKRPSLKRASQSGHSI